MGGIYQRYKVSLTQDGKVLPRGLLFNVMTTVTVLNCMVKTLLRGWSYVKCSSHKIILILILVPTE